MSAVTNLEVGNVKVGLVEGSPEVIVGSYEKSEIDVSDVEQFGDGPAVSAAGALIHEVTEQASKQLEGKPYEQAHQDGIRSENGANGSERGSDTANLRSNGSSLNYQRNNTLNGTIDINFRVNGSSTPVRLEIYQNDIKRVRQ